MFKPLILALMLSTTATTVGAQHTLNTQIHNQHPPHNQGAWTQNGYHHRSLNGTGLGAPADSRHPPVINVPGADLSRFRSGQFVDRDLLNDPWRNDPIPLTEQDQWIEGHGNIVHSNLVTVGGTPVRFHGIDILEEDQLCYTGTLVHQCGREAREALSMLFQGERVRCRIESMTIQGEIIGTCLTPRHNINAMMVSNGHAMTWKAGWSPYEGEQQQAHGLQAGAWATDFVHPETFRQRVSEQAQSLANDIRTGQQPHEANASPFQRGNPGRATPVFSVNQPNAFD